MPSRPRARLTRLLLAAALLGGCTGVTDTSLVCPLLPPGATATLTAGAPMPPVPTDDTAGATRTGHLGLGELVAHPIALAAGQTVRARLDLTGARAVLWTYGPRDAFGGFPHCLGLTPAANDGHAVATTVTADAAGEYLIVAGAPPATTPGDYTLTVTCEAGCDAPAPCPTLAERGCPDARCDGELARDADGCPTCDCQPAALCAPIRAAGPGGSCVLPACDCAGDAPDAPICGTDGRTWPSTCAARCAGVAVAKPDACAFACPALAACDAPCFGPRAIGSDGCPTCDCLPDFAPDAASCAACPDAGAPVCGGDGVTYPSRCAARCAGARILYPAACVDGCRAAPADCDLDCAWGLALVPEGADCLACRCAAAPSTACTPEGAPVCVALPGLPGATTVGSPCLAVHLGADDGQWGPCGVPCATDDDCPAGARCPDAGYLAGRCLVAPAPDCGCAALLAPVCGADGATYDNRCLAACGAVAVAHDGPCCTAPSTCPEGELPSDARGCPTGCPAAPAACADNAASAPVCAPDGALLETDACRAHASGAEASEAWCAP